MRAYLALPMLLATLPACARDLQFGDDSRYLDASVEADAEVVIDGEVVHPPVGGPHVTHTLDARGVVTRVDATHAERWVYIDLDTGLEIVPDAPETDAVWDVALRRSNIALNGGVSGTGGVAATSLRVPYDDVVSAPTEGFVTDAADGDDDDTIPDYAFRFWYLYDVETHILTPDAITYVVRTTEGAHVKLRIEGYYDGVGTSGRPSFHWRALP